MTGQQPEIELGTSAQGHTALFGGVRLRWSMISHPGQVRTNNEDAALAGPGLFFLADGMGGHEAGEVASAAALEALATLESTGPLEITDAALAVKKALEDAHDTINAIESEAGRNAGTTVTGAMVTLRDGAPNWLISNIGDSRTYLLRDGVLEQITRDHSKVQELVDAGQLTEEEARTDRRRNIITRALGAGMDPDPAFYNVEIARGDRVLVCSDGLNGELTDAQLQDYLLRDASIDSIAEDLVLGALYSGGRDNVTVVIIDALELGVAVDAADTDALWTEQIRPTQEGPGEQNAPT